MLISMVLPTGGIYSYSKYKYTQRVQNEGKCDFGFFPSLDYCDSILIYKEVPRLRPSVQGDPFFGRRRRWSSEHHETDNAYRGPRAGVGGV